MRIITDIFAYCSKHIPRWNTISISGYHIREAGSTAAQEIAFTLANAIAYVQAAIDAGLDVDDFGPRISFFWNGHNHFFEEVAKFRASRRMWHKIMTERFGAKDPKSAMLRFHTQTGGSTLTAQQPVNNVVRVALQALAAVMGGTQSLHTNGFDEALSLPTEEAARLALRTQQIIGYEAGVTDTPDPLAGSYLVESMTDEVERLAWEYIDKIDEMGGAVSAIEAGYQMDEIEQAAYDYTRSIDDDQRVIVGLNKFQIDNEPEPSVFPIDPTLEGAQQTRLAAYKADRDAADGDNPAGSVARDRSRYGKPAVSDEGSLAGRSDTRRGERRAAGRLRSVPTVIPGRRWAGFIEHADLECCDIVTTGRLTGQAARDRDLVRCDGRRDVPDLRQRTDAPIGTSTCSPIRT